MGKLFPCILNDEVGNLEAFDNMDHIRLYLVTNEKGVDGHRGYEGQLVKDRICVELTDRLESGGEGDLYYVDSGWFEADAVDASHGQVKGHLTNIGRVVLSWVSTKSDSNVVVNMSIVGWMRTEEVFPDLSILG